MLFASAAHVTLKLNSLMTYFSEKSSRDSLKSVYGSVNFKTISLKLHTNVSRVWRKAFFSLIHLMRAIARAHPSILTISLMRVKIARATYCLGHWNVENERKIKNIKLNS